MIWKIYRIKKRFIMLLFVLICGLLVLNLFGWQFRIKPESRKLQGDNKSNDPPRYLQYDKHDIWLGDMECSDVINCQSSPPSTVDQAKTLCEGDSRCKGFAFKSSSNEVFFKNNVKGGLIRKDDITTYIKSEHAQGSEKPPQGVCAVPINHTVLTDVSQGCNLAEFDPFDPSILQYIGKPNLHLKCNGKRLTRYRNGTLTIIDKASNIIKTEYFTITRTPESDSDFIQGKLTPIDVVKSNTLNDEFIGVKTTTQDGREHAEYHGAVAPKPDVVARPRSATGIPVNVMIVGIDSISNAHFQRALPKAYKYLTEDLKSIVLKGYTIVGDGTTPALTAMLTGYFEKELPEARRGFPGSKPVDDWPWVFKDFKKAGYATLFSEDEPVFGSYNYRLLGFKDPPSDHFGRYFWLAARINNPFCVHGKPQHLIHLDYLESFFEAYDKSPKFGLGFFSSVAHNNLESVYQMGDDFYTFLKNIEKRLNDTILIVMGDHGFRYGEARATLQGHLEERLPFISFTLPSWYERNHPQFVSNLRHNVKTVTSPFDVYLTLRHILAYPDVPKLPKGSRGSSLFEKIPLSRDCESAGVLEHYCPCLSLKTADTKHTHIKHGALAIVEHINKLLTEDEYAANLCHQLKVNKILSSHQQMPNTKFQNFLGSADIHGRLPKFSEGKKTNECNYRIQIQTAPGEGVFDASVRFKDGTFAVTGDISRINKYGDQPRCILGKNRELRKYCLCKDL